ncbi:MAG: hypothetical protein ACLGHN_03500 [Bacteriovoracia bacterium]
MIKNLFRLDLRSLALARIFLGILAFYDISRRIPDLKDFFVDSGILTRWQLLESFQHPWKMSLLYLNGSYSWALILAIIGLIASFTFTIGWRTRLSNAILWLIIISFQQRFPEAATSGGDMLLRIFFFYSFFLPMNARYSFDGAVSETKVKENEFFNIFTSAWIVQIMLLYILTFFYKWAPVYHTTFDAVWYMLQLDIFTTDFGKWLGQHYMATKVLSFSSYALEIVGPLLLVIPFKRDVFRSIAVISFWLFHLGIGATLHLGNFVPICLIIWVGLIPTSWWDFLAVKFKTASEIAANFYYNAEEDFSRKIALISKEMLFLNIKILPAPKSLLQKGQSFAFESPEGKVSIEKGIVSQLLLTSSLKPVRKIGKFLDSEITHYLTEIKEVGEVNIFGNNLQTGNKTGSSSRLKSIFQSLLETLGFGEIKFKLNKFERLLGAFLLLLIIGWNIEGYVKDRKWYIGSPFDEIMFALQLNQGWAMFAPHPQRSDGWWIMEGVLKDGTKWDALNDKAVTFDRPESVFQTYASDDWRKFLDNLQSTRSNDYLLLLGKHLCRRWNSMNAGGKTLQSFKLHFMQEWTNPPSEPRAEVEKQTLWNHECF